jgi:hypothetical protein
MARIAYEPCHISVCENLALGYMTHHLANFLIKLFDVRSKH